MADQILEILEYLHGRKPAVIHWDIKPSNLILNDKGELFLIDFGAVQVVENHTLVGSTVVGTSGYMPPEQRFGFDRTRG